MNWRAIIGCLLAGWTLFGHAQPGRIGRTFPSEKQRVENAEYGFEVTRWTRTGNNHHLYFNVESFIDTGRCIILSDRSGGSNLFVLDLSDGSMTQMTDEKSIRGVWHLPRLRTVWYLADRTLTALNTATGEARAIHTFDTLRPESFAVTADGASMVFAANKNPGFSTGHSTGPYALFRFDLRSKELAQISPDLGFRMGHVQTNPADPTLVTYCWQHAYREGAPGIVGNTPARIWWNTVDGTDGGPLGVQEFGLHRTHEFWFPDGRSMGYTARYHFGPKKGKQYIGIISADGRENVMMEANVGAAHSQVSADGNHWVADLFDGPRLVLFTIDGKKIMRTRVLYRHDSSWGGQSTHPHPHFSPDGRYVLFTTDKSGSPQVYTVRVDIDR
jgi:oligogalacturonide lyase